MAKQIIFSPDEWGGCPRCHHNDGGLISDDMRQWFWCKRHKFKWQAGVNLVSAEQQMPRWALQRQAFILAGCHEVKPWYPQSENEFREKMYSKSSRTGYS